MSQEACQCDCCCKWRVKWGDFAQNRRHLIHKLSNMFDLETFILRKMQWSLKTFGPMDFYGAPAIVQHLRKELKEIEAEPNDLEEWVDIIHLGLDGAWRAGHSAHDICQMLAHKQTKNEHREWPDWKQAQKDVAIEHVEPAECNDPDCPYDFRHSHNGKLDNDE